MQTTTFTGNGTIQVARGTDAEVLLNTFDEVIFEFAEIQSDNTVQFRNNKGAIVKVALGRQFLAHCDPIDAGLHGIYLLHA